MCLQLLSIECENWEEAFRVEHIIVYMCVCVHVLLNVCACVCVCDCVCGS